MNIMPTASESYFCGNFFVHFQQILANLLLILVFENERETKSSKLMFVFHILYLNRAKLWASRRRRLILSNFPFILPTFRAVRAFAS